MDRTKKDARIAGLLYLTLLAAPLRLVYIPAKLIVSGDPAATARNIAAHETLFRLGIAGDLLTGTMTIFLLMALHRLFERVDRRQAALLVILGSLVVTPIYFLNTLNDVAALEFSRGADFLAAFTGPQRESMAALFLHLHHHGVVANEIFWGLWLFPFGILAYRSGFIPRILGLWLIVNGCAYLAISFSGLLLPQYEEAVSRYAFPVMFGELAMMLWLVVWGAKEPPGAATVS